MPRPKDRGPHQSNHWYNDYLTLGASIQNKLKNTDKH